VFRTATCRGDDAATAATTPGGGGGGEEVAAKKEQNAVPRSEDEKAKKPGALARGGPEVPSLHRSLARSLALCLCATHSLARSATHVS